MFLLLTHHLIPWGFTKVAEFIRSQLGQSQSPDPVEGLESQTEIQQNTAEQPTFATEGNASELLALESDPTQAELKNWISRSDSESSWSSSDGSSTDIDEEESERLWDFFSSPKDPYNPMCFAACTISSTTPQTTTVSKHETPRSDTDTEERESSILPSPEDDEELWKSLCQKDDPFHPLEAGLEVQSSPNSTLQREEDSDALDVHHTQTSSTKGKKQAKAFQKSRAVKPSLPERQMKYHSHPDTTLVPWKGPGQTRRAASEKEATKADTAQKKVRFSPLVHVHVMRTWPFARQASRKGHWEEMARDRDHFRRRIWEAEQFIGQCFTQPHREKIRGYLDSALK